MYQLDCGIAGEHLVLRAAELGLGTCWIGWFDRRAAHKALRLPRHVKVVVLISVGHPSEGARSSQASAEGRRPRKPLSALLSRDAWGVDFPGAASQEEREK